MFVVSSHVKNHPESGKSQDEKFNPIPVGTCSLQHANFERFWRKAFEDFA